MNLLDGWFSYKYYISGSGISSGVILQRFPEKDWADTPFIEGIEWVTMEIYHLYLQIYLFPF